MATDFQTLNQLRSISRAIDQLSSGQTMLDGRVREVAEAQHHANGEITSLHVKIDAFILETRRASLVTNAQAKVIEIGAQLDREFGHHDDVRRLVSGILQAMDTGIVTQETMRDAVEGRMIDTPRYWLAPALVALAAWIRDDRELAGRSLAEAVRRDSDKTSLFFALVLTRHRRFSATARWVDRYVGRQDPGQLSRDFTVILDAVATGALGAESRPRVMAQVVQWHQRLSTDADVVAAQAQRWRQLLDGMAVGVGNRFTALPQVCSTWERHRAWFEQATIFGEADRHFRERFETPLSQSDDLRVRVDAILDALVTNHDADERPLRREEARQRAIIAHSGDMAKVAEVVAAETEAHETQVDFLTLLTNAAFYREAAGATEGTERMAIALARDWVVTAAEQVEHANRDQRPAALGVEIGGWKGEVGQRSEAELSTSLSRHVDAQTALQIALVKMPGGAIASAVIGGILGGITLIGLMASASSGGSPACFLFLALVAAGLGIYAFIEHGKLPGRRDAIRRTGEGHKATALNLLRGTLAETVDLYAAWHRHIEMAPPFRDYLRGLDPASFTLASPDQGREIVTEPAMKVPHQDTYGQPAGSGPEVLDGAEVLDHVEVLDDAGRALAVTLPSWDLLPPSVFVQRSTAS